MTAGEFWCKCADKGIAVEVAGISHDKGRRPQRDRAGDAKLAALGIKVVRITAADVLADGDGVAHGMVRSCLDALHPSALRAATSPTGGDFTGVPG